MNFLQRFKKAWELAGEPDLTVKEKELYRETLSESITNKPIGMATIVEDDPIDVFADEDDKTS